jgi:hypothetical protein
LKVKPRFTLADGEKCATLMKRDARLRDSGCIHYFTKHALFSLQEQRFDAKLRRWQWMQRRGGAGLALRFC